MDPVTELSPDMYGNLEADGPHVLVCVCIYACMYKVIINKCPKVNKSRTNIKVRKHFFNAFK